MVILSKQRKSETSGLKIKTIDSVKVQLSGNFSILKSQENRKNR
jgi:hypothetical protein